jgi:hypothetical protein
MPKHPPIVFPGGTTKFLRADNTFVVPPFDPTPFIITPMSRLSIGTELAALGVAAPAEAAWPAANRAIYVPFVLSESVTVVKLFIYMGNSNVGNVDVGIYDSDLARVVSAGSTTDPASAGLQEFDVTDTTMGPGQFYLAMAYNATGNVFSWITGDLQMTKTLGVAQEASAFALPATATLAAATSDYIPVMGLSLRTLVV